MEETLVDVGVDIRAINYMVRQMDSINFAAIVLFEDLRDAGCSDDVIKTIEDIVKMSDLAFD